MKYLYVAGPLYGSGHQDDNIRAALEVASILKTDFGDHITPFVPHLYFFWNLIDRHPREFWMELDEQWIKRCDGMLRIQGESPGSSVEEGWCEDYGVPWQPLFFSEDKHTLRIEVSRALRLMWSGR